MFHNHDFLAAGERLGALMHEAQALFSACPYNLAVTCTLGVLTLLFGYLWLRNRRKAKEHDDLMAAADEVLNAVGASMRVCRDETPECCKPKCNTECTVPPSNTCPTFSELKEINKGLIEINERLIDTLGSAAETFANRTANMHEESMNAVQNVVNSFTAPEDEDK